MRIRISRSQFGILGVYLSIGAVTALHYSTGEHAHQLHDIYRRLYYLPIIVAAFLHGFRGGLVAAAVVCIAYAPHATGHISHDPATTTQKSLEMLLYLFVGVLTGTLVSRLKGAQRQVEAAASDLQMSLSQLRKTVEQLRAAEHQLVRTAQLAAVGRLSAGLAHEIRNPLASIQGSAEILADDFPPEHPKRRLLAVLLEESHRLNDVLTRFLSFARPRELVRTPFAIVSEIETAIGLVQTQRETQRTRIELTVEGTDTSSSALSVMGDREQLRQVLLNLLLNAVQASGPDGAVRVQCATENGRIILRISDDGPGFSAEAIDNAFTPFFTTKEKGTGLGLAISHRILESHGGQIEVGNLPQGGGLVTLELPGSVPSESPHAS